ncbi:MULTISPECIES: TetR family transcriptional regulator C-terminal domain-containing protein [unclassified Saccharothrix]|uniref:TetR family transcriptional regulator C-terminal domain-containing protein n=1 Tax=unclassified Saccharothrix TaxID=2593673 RepID=UPI00307F41AC
MDVLVSDALDRCVLALNARIERSLTTGATAGEVLRRCLGALVTGDEESVRLLRFGAAVLGRAIADPTMARVLTPGDDNLITFTADLIAAARGNALDTDRVDADICWSLATSLGVDIALGHRTPEAAQAVLDHQVDRVLRTTG